MFLVHIRNWAPFAWWVHLTPWWHFAKDMAKNFASLWIGRI